MAVRKYWTLEQVRNKIKRDLDIEGEAFIRSQELDDYINEAIDEAEAEIHSQYEDYFLTKAEINLVSNQAEYALPDNIFAHKIRRIVYDNSSSVYKVKRIQDWRKFEQKAIADNFETSDIYQYFLINEVAGAPRILLVPKAREDGPQMTIWYIRQANRLEESTDILDIPEFANFIFQYVKVRVYEKEVHPNAQQARLDLQQQRSLMVGTLASMTPDAENKIELDMSHYEEMN